MAWATWTDRGKSRCLANASFATAIKQPYALTPACMALDSGLFTLCPSNPSTFLLPELKQLVLLSPTAGYSPGLFYNMALRGGTLKLKSHRRKGSLSPTQWGRFSGSKGAQCTSPWLPKAQLTKSNGQLPSKEQPLFALSWESPTCLSTSKK